MLHGSEGSGRRRQIRPWRAEPPCLARRRPAWRRPSAPWLGRGRGSTQATGAGGSEPRSRRRGGVRGVSADERLERGPVEERRQTGDDPSPRRPDQTADQTTQRVGFEEGGDGEEAVGVEVAVEKTIDQAAERGPADE